MFYRSMSIVMLVCATAGCVGLPQQARFEIGESAGLLRVQAHGTFFTSRLVTLDQHADGAVAVHAASLSAARTLPPVDSFTNDTFAQLNEALLPFLLPACSVVPTVNPR